MTKATELLKMIETVDPADTAKMDEIDSRVWCYLKQYATVELSSGEVMDAWRHYILEDNIPQYTRSRDALKAIRPDGCWFHEIKYWHGQLSYQCQYYIYVDKRYEKKLTPNLPTEELAELHAIIQAIEWERSQ
ncbi:hypothetical protein KAR91_83865 [Candidatus Pacearchaeota archaeon]|nr:hypothetical protein [Candidatus Pacearchaeota archaeon]